MNQTDITPQLQIEANRLAKLFPVDHEWFWDQGTSSLLTVLRGDECKGIRESLTHACNLAWDHHSAAQVDPRLQGLIAKLLGIRKDQSLHATPLNNHLTLFATYWPWSSGARVSVRVGIYNESTGDNEVGVHATELKRAFHADEPFYFKVKRNAPIPLVQNSSPTTTQAKITPTSRIDTTRATLQAISQRAGKAPLKKNRTPPAVDVKIRRTPTSTSQGQLNSVANSSQNLITTLRASRVKAQSSLPGLKNRKRFTTQTSPKSGPQTSEKKKYGVSTGTLKKKK